MCAQGLSATSTRARSAAAKVSAPEDLENVFLRGFLLFCVPTCTIKFTWRAMPDGKPGISAYAAVRSVGVNWQRGALPYFEPCSTQWAEGRPTFFTFLRGFTLTLGLSGLLSYVPVCHPYGPRKPGSDSAGDDGKALRKRLWEMPTWHEAVVVDPELAGIDCQILTWMDTNVVILIENLATVAPVRSDLDRQATATAINALLLQLSQRPTLHGEAILEAAAKMIYHALFVEES